MAAPTADEDNRNSDESSPLFTAVDRADRLSDKVAAQIQETILERRMGAGQPLPSERQLGEQFGVSRTVIREAVRSLEAKGLVESAGRGLRVATVNSAAVSESMSLYLHGRPISYEKVHQVREMIEVEVAGYAATRATEADIARLTELCERFARPGIETDDAAALDVEFHSALADATQNELYGIMLDSMHDVLIQPRRATLAVAGRLGKGVRAHRRILGCIATGDVKGARDAMRRHLQDSLHAWRRLDQAGK